MPTSFATDDLIWKIGIPVLVALIGGLLRVGLMNRLEKLEKKVDDLVDPKRGIQAEVLTLKLEQARTLATNEAVEKAIKNALSPMLSKLEDLDKLVDRMGRMLNDVLNSKVNGRRMSDPRE